MQDEILDDSKSYWKFVERLSAGVGGEGEEAACPPRPAAVRRLPYRLESEGTNVTSLDEDVPGVVSCIVALHERCRARTCPICGPRLGWGVRQRLLSKAQCFRKPALLSVTLDRKQFDSPEDGHRNVTEGRYISRFMRLLGVKHWAWVLEFQMKSGDGWPHWHILIDLADVPAKKLDLKRAWLLWRDKWKLGGIDLSYAKGFREPEHAVYYITKYLTKMPPAFPLWVLGSSRAIRFVQGSRAIGALVANAKPTVDVAVKIQPDLPFRAPRKPLLEKMALCGTSTRFMAAEFDYVNDECSFTYLGSANVAPEDLLDLSLQGLVSARAASIDWGEQEVIIVTENSVGGIVSALRRLKNELSDREVGYDVSRAQQIEARQWAIVEHHARHFQPTREDCVAA